MVENIRNNNIVTIVKTTYICLSLDLVGCCTHTVLKEKGQVIFDITVSNIRYMAQTVGGQSGNYLHM